MSDAPELFLIQGDLCEEKSAINAVVAKLDQLNAAIGTAWDLNVDVTLGFDKHKVKVTKAITCSCTLDLFTEEA
jgi:hypothetical protein